MNTANRNLIIGGLAIALIIAILAPFLASTNPDGLDSTAESLEVPESEAAFQSPLPDYALPGMEDNPLGGVISLVVGTILVLLVALGLAKLISKKNNKENGNGQEE
jgi:cobalt/nickel transport protein